MLRKAHTPRLQAFRGLQLAHVAAGEVEEVRFVLDGGVSTVALEEVLDLVSENANQQLKRTRSAEGPPPAAATELTGVRINAEGHGRAACQHYDVCQFGVVAPCLGETRATA